jgi:hypothetical protein
LGSGEGYTLHPQRGSSSTVDSGGSFAFRLSVNEGYTFDQYKVLVNNTELTSDENGIYTINNITEDKKVTLQGTPVPKAYSVTLTQGTGYTLHPYGGSSSPVDSGGSFTFQFSVKEGYTAGPYKVFVNNTEVTSDENGIYTINNITENKTVTVQGTIVVRTYDVTLTSGNGYTLKGYGDSSSPVERGGSFTFQLTVDKGYTAVSYKVFVNTIEVPLDADGRYTIGDITTAQTVYAEGTFELSRYDVTLTSGNGYTLSAHEGSSSPADHGGSFTFQFSVKEGYTAEMYRVLVNSAEVKLDENGRYTIGDITTAQTVIVNGEFKLTSGTGGGAIGGTEEGIDPEFTLLVTVIVPATIAIMAALLLLRGKKQDGDHEQYQ